MSRIIRPSWGAYAVFGVIICFPVLLPCVLSLCKGRIPNLHFLIESGKVLGELMLVILPIVWIMSRIRLVVNDTEIIVHQAFRKPVTVRFSEIAYSAPQVFVQRRHPAKLIIHFTEESREPLTLFLTKFPSTEVAWLLSLEQLKVRNGAGRG